MAVALFAIQRLRQNNRERIYNVRRDAFENTDIKFRQRFRLPIAVARQLIADLEPAMGPPKRSSSLPNAIKVLIALRFYARGSHQLDVAENKYLNVSQPSVSRAIDTVSRVINSVLLRQWVKRPKTEPEKNAIKRSFAESHNFPGVVGAIDCTHVAIVAPPVNHPVYQEHAYINRKQYHSINVQLVCDMLQRILNVNARYPGRSHDQFIFANSKLKRNIERENDRKSWLIGDGGYTQQPYMMVPVPNAAPGSPEESYNRRHAKARAVIERCNGLLKARWRCLLKSRTLHYMPPEASRIINSCVVLHNMCIHHRVPLDIEDDEDEEEDDDSDADDGNAPVAGQRRRGQLTAGQRHRALLIGRHFTN